MTPIKIKHDALGLHIAFEHVVTEGNFAAACDAAIAMAKDLCTKKSEVAINFHVAGDLTLGVMQIVETSDTSTQLTMYLRMKCRPISGELRDHLIHCVSVEREGSGGCHWWQTATEADVFYENSLQPGSKDAGLQDTVTRFSLKLPTHLTDDEITVAVDKATWDIEYEVLARRVGTSGILAYKPILRLSNIASTVLKAA